ncbi:irs1 [Pungitius sinensis]
MEQDPDSQQHQDELQSSPPSRPYEELFCSSNTSLAVGPLTGALVTPRGPHSDVVKQGYLGMLDRSHRRYFVLRAGSHTGPGRLEWYKNQERSAGKAALFGSSKLGVMYLRCCLGVSRSGSSRKGSTVALYAKDQTVVLVVEDQWEQEAWYLAIRKLMEEERKDEERVEEDDGYCTLPSAASFKEVWPVTVRPTGLGCTKSLAGESRLCLTAASLVLVRVTACGDLPSLTIPLLSVRRFGHLDGSFYLELGRSAPNGPGEIWMGARDQGNPAFAHHIHEVVIETVRALRALPDFSRSPASTHSQLQALLVSKRCRPKYRDKAANVRPTGARPLLRNPGTQTSRPECHLEPDKPHQTQPGSPRSSASHLGPLGSPRSSTSESDGYVEMETDQLVPVDQGRDGDPEGAAMATGDRRSGSWEPGEVQRLGYMMMSPPGGHGSPALPQDDYVTMASPQKHNAQPRPPSPSSSLQTSFDSFTFDSSSLHAWHRRTNEPSPPRRLLTLGQQPETGAGQSERSISCSSQPQEAVRSAEPSAVTTPFVQSGPDHAGPGRASRAASAPSGRRWRLSLFLPSCLRTQTESL